MWLLKMRSGRFYIPAFMAQAGREVLQVSLVSAQLEKVEPIWALLGYHVRLRDASHSLNLDAQRD